MNGKANAKRGSQNPLTVDVWPDPCSLILIKYQKPLYVSWMEKYNLSGASRQHGWKLLVIIFLDATLNSMVGHLSHLYNCSDGRSLLHTRCATALSGVQGMGGKL